MNRSLEPTWLANAHRHYRLGNLSAARQLLQPHRTHPEAAALLLRCLSEQGYFQEAHRYGRCATTPPTKQTAIEQEMALRCAFLQIYLAGDPQPMIVAGEVVLVERAANRITAVAQDLTACTRVAAINWGLADTADLPACIQQLAAAANLYRQLGDEEAAQTAQIKQAQTLLMLSPPSSEQAKKLLHRVQEQARAGGHQHLEAEVTLRLAEMAPTTTPPTALNDYPPGYRQALALYEQCGHWLGVADVQRSWGEQLIRFGLDGSQSLQQALTHYTEQDNPSGMSRALSQLAMFHVRQGDLANGLAYHQQGLEVAQTMGFKQAGATAQMGIGDIYFRTGDYGRALAAYEQAKKLIPSPIMQAMINLNLANTYTLMNLPDRAEVTCRTAIATLSSGRPNANLSLAYFILGNILGAKKEWHAALVTWRDGLAVDETLGDVHRQAEKLQSMAQATVQQHYRGRDSTIPETAFQEAMVLFDDAFTRLIPLQDSETAVLRANIRQLQGQTAITARYFTDAEQHLLQARHQYANLHMGMETAVTDAMLGLLYYGAGNEGQHDLYDAAITHYHHALAYYRSVKMRDQIWPIHYYLANTFFRRGLVRLSAEAQAADWQRAHEALQQAADIVDFVRGRFAQTDKLAQEEARVGLVANKDKLYRFAIRLTNTYLKDKTSAFNWLQRYRGRAFLDALTITQLHAPTIDNESLFEQETIWLYALNREPDQSRAVDLLEKLHQIWSKMESAGLEEFVTLRRGAPVQWHEMSGLLKRLS